MPDQSFGSTGRRTSRRNGVVAAVVSAGVLLSIAPAAHALSPTEHQAGVSSAKTASPASHGAATRQLTPAVRAQLDRAVARVMRQAHVPGAVVSLSIPGKGNYVRAFGVADKRTKAPMSTRVNMRIGSVTKTFTATAVLRLVDQGKVRLDDPIATYVRGVPQGDRITLRHLLEMRSGLAEYMADPDWGRAWAKDPHRKWKPAELLPYAFKHSPEAAPGAKYQYSNTNYVLLGMVVEKVSGESLGNYLRHHVAEAAHLRHTFLPKDAEFPAPNARGYTGDPVKDDGSVVDATTWSPSSGGAAGAMISNLADVRRWAPMLAKGTLLKHTTQKERSRFLPTDFEGVGYGLGVFDNHGWIGHNGSLPGYQTVVVHQPRTRATLVLHTTTDIRYQGVSPSTLLAKEITSIATPRYVYDIPAPKPAPSAKGH